MSRAKGQRRKNQLARLYWRNGRRHEDTEPRKRQRWDAKKEQWIRL